jgi:acetolactate synthase-1/2/3 large subunit
VIALPVDMLTAVVEAEDAGPYKTVRPHPGPGDMARLREMLAAAERPFVIIGGGGWTPEAVADIKAFIEANGLPVGCSFRCQDLFDNRHANYAGDVGIGINPALAQRIKASDLLLVVGARLGEMTTSGYTLVNLPKPHQKLIHVHAGAEELGRVYQAELPINAGMAEFAAAARALTPVDPKAWSHWREQARADYLDNIRVPKVPGNVQIGEIMEWLNANLPEDVILANGAGNYATWMHRFFQYRRFRSELAPTNGAMGYGVPAGIAAKAVHPERLVISWNGDGCFMMNGQELATAVQYKLPVIFVVVNNGMYGTIRMHQEREYPGRVSGTDLVNPDFAALARAYGAVGETVETTAEFVPAFQRAVAAKKPALIEIRLDPEALTPRASLTQIREAALKAKK